MTRRTIDIVVSTTGLIVAVALLVLGGLLLWGQSFISDQVHDQLAAQKIFFPPKDSSAIEGPQYEALQQYAGQQLTTGEQAQAYADHFIAVHLEEVAGGKTYAEISAAAQENPDDAALKGQAEALFRGTTLRGLLLNAYAFDTTARIAGDAAIVCFVAGGILTLLAGLGFWHASRESAVTGTGAVALARREDETKARAA